MPVTITRNELYEAVWKRPIVQVAREYGISDVALKKICRKMAIPTPERGYWRRKERGYNVVTARLRPLPDYAVGQVTISPRPNRPPAEQKPSAAPDGLVPALEVLVDRQGMHPLVEGARASLAKARPDERGILKARAKTRLYLPVSPATLERALLTVDRLIAVLEALGNRAHLNLEQTPTLRFTIDGEDLGISVEEKVSAHPYRPKPSDSKKYPWQLPRYEYEPTGKLTLRIHGKLPWGMRTSWSDGKVQRVEALTGKVVIALYEAAAAQRQKRIDDERQAREREEQWRRAEEARELRRLELQRRKHLQQLAVHFEEAQRMRRFVEAVEAHRDTLSAVTVQGMAMDTWLEWAKDYATRYNPLNTLGYWDIDELVPLWDIHDTSY
jgi:hypothetical protein